MKMTQAYQDAINGTLLSQDTGVAVDNLTFYNGTEIPLDVYLVSDTGCWLGGYAFSVPGGSPTVVSPLSQWPATVGGTDTGWYFVFLNSYSGAFAAAIQANSAEPQGNNNVVSVGCADLLYPNNIGSVPKPNQSVLIPADSPRIVVGCGTLPTGYTVAREQYWQRLPDSYSLSGGASKTISYTVTSGMERTTSEESQLAASVTGSASAGWGPISATVSASLSASSTSFQQVTTSLETTSFVSQTYTNPNQSPEMFLYWQLTNVLTVFDSNGNPASSMIYGAEGPALIYDCNLDELPPRPLEKLLPMSAGMRARLSSVSVEPAPVRASHGAEALSPAAMRRRMQ